MNDTGTEEPFSFLYVKVTAKKKDDMFYKRFDQALTVERNDS
jgi:hypothetical protein